MKAKRPGRGPDGGEPSWPLAAWAGALAGLLLALGDFGASWLWMPWWSDRGWLLLHLVALLTPLGALSAIAYDVVRRRIARGLTRVSRPLPTWLPEYLLALLPTIGVVHRLFSGGMMSRLPARSWLEGLALVLSLAGLALGLSLGAALLRRLGRGSPRSRLRLIIALLVGSFLVAKTDQLFYPKLYDYLHASLGALSFALAFQGLRMLLEDRRGRLGKAAWPGRTAMAACVLVAFLAVGLGTLRRHQNVQVSLLEPRAAMARSVLLGFEPLLARARPSRATAQAATRAFRARR
ncbi:MAG: hypothetical protein GXP55_14245, partial [Deltaproteobacteria bacterium]|nr:hypothetical protein [Deltaproteobacteria bacterium]